MKKFLIPVFSLLILLFLFPASCVSGAKTGLLLWFNTMIPSVFPFILLTNIIREFNGMRYFQKLFGFPVKKLFRCSPEASYPVIIGFLCGYPMGAKAVADSYETGCISRAEAVYLLSFCNNPSPMFIINYVALASLQNEALILPLFLIIYISTYLCALLNYLLIFRKKQKRPAAVKLKTMNFSPDESIERCIMSSLGLMQKIGVYMIIFAILCQLIVDMPIALPYVKICAAGLLEQTTGLSVLCRQPCPIEIKMILASVFTCFGGFAIVAQTYSVICQQKLPLGHYILSKALHAALAGFLAFVYTLLF